jgi:site-specific DNA-methyltransferase (adenine-specific)
MIELNKFYVGESVQFIKDNIPDNFVDLTVTSPPYDNLRTYNGFTFEYKTILSELYRVTKVGGIVVWVVGDRISNGDRTLTSFRQALCFQNVGFNVHDVMIYRKKNTPFMRSNAYTNCYEFMFVFSKKKVNTFNRLMDKTVRQGFEGMPFNKGADGVNRKVVKELKPEKTRVNIWEYAVGLGGTTKDRDAFKHPAVFPEKLAEDHILTWTNPGDIVFDPMCGSGTTCKMAYLNDRKFIGIDMSEEYINNICIPRLESYGWHNEKEIL